MSRRPKPDSPLRAGRFDVACQISYELGLLLAVFILLLVAIHQALTHRAVIDKTLDATHVAATGISPQDFRVGEAYPLYRFNPDWEEPIGEIKVSAVTDSRVEFAFRDSDIKWTMGRVGRVTGVDGAYVKLDMGSDLGFKPGDKVNVFSDRVLFATVQIVSTGPRESLAGIFGSTERDTRPETLVGKVASEFVVVNQVVVPYSPLVHWLDALSVLALIGIYTYLRAKCKSSPFLRYGPGLAKRFRPAVGAKLAFHALVGVPACWFLGIFVLRAAAYLVAIFCDQIVHAKIPPALSTESFLRGLSPAFGILFAAYLIVLVRFKGSPFGFLAKKLAFRGGVFKHSASDLPEHITMWMFQAIIVYAFGRTLGLFFQQNLSVGISASWPNAPAVVVPLVPPVSFEGAGRSIASIGYALTHVPSPATQDAMFMTVQTIIYNACIFACLFGYGYSLLGYLWGKRIRNIDFTVVGWLTNAICYSPLFGIVLWQMLPPTAGPDPTMADGALRTITFLGEVYLNVVYTLSIWNLGPMFGVMTDKGVRTTGFYSVVRHPNYTMESLMFILLFSRGLSTPAQWFAAGSFILVYWLRSEREDQFMSVSNPDYLLYKARTIYKFIPGIY
ncbi:MAG: methyltransferase [Fimbriimonas sp.]|nr:methyltransferase [Fimbriimonas sp.]